MTQQWSDPNMGDLDMENADLMNVHEGMKVYDRDGKEIGKVERVYFGSVGEDTARRGVGPADTDDVPKERDEGLWDAINEAFTGVDDDLPETVRGRLVRSGFIRLDSAGLFSAERYITPDQIASVSGDGVHLNVSKDDLIKRLWLSMGSTDFYVDYESEVPNFTEDLKAEVEERLGKLASEDTDIVGAAVAVTAPGKSEQPFLYQARVVLYARPEDVAAVKKDDTVQGALKGALSAVERQVRQKREKLGEPWKRKDLPGNPT